MDEELPKRPAAFILGSDLERHSVGDLEALAAELERELARVRRAIAGRQDVRAKAEALFKAAARGRPEDD
jgi:uncharacterized small protein (DUF1192 family)